MCVGDGLVFCRAKIALFLSRKKPRTLSLQRESDTGYCVEWLCGKIRVLSHIFIVNETQ